MELSSPELTAENFLLIFSRLWQSDLSSLNDHQRSVTPESRFDPCPRYVTRPQFWDHLHPQPLQRNRDSSHEASNRDPFF